MFLRMCVCVSKCMYVPTYVCMCKLHLKVSSDFVIGQRLFDLPIHKMNYFINIIMFDISIMKYH
jgi:hypothetical protein